MSQLPQLLTPPLLTRWKAILDPVIASPMAGVSILPNVTLVPGNTIINHGLGKTMSGWFLADAQGPATIYRSQPLNDKTLTLTSSAAVVVSIGVF